VLSVSVVVPTYNERENIGPLVKGIRAALSGRSYEILVVDDGSPDGTREQVRALSRTVPQLRLIEKPRKEGIGAALRYGYDRSRLAVLLSIDADLSFDTADIPRLLGPIEEGYDMSLGVRHAAGGGYETPDWRIRVKFWVSSLGNRFVAALLGHGVRDVSANFRALRRSVWERLKTSDNTNALLLEMILKARAARCRIYEVPVKFRDRRRGESKLNLVLELPRYLSRLIVYTLRYRFR